MQTIVTPTMPAGETPELDRLHAASRPPRADFEAPDVDPEQERQKLAAARKARQSRDKVIAEKLKSETIQATIAYEAWKRPQELWENAGHAERYHRDVADVANHDELRRLRALAPAGLRKAFAKINARRDEDAARCREQLEKLIEVETDIGVEIEKVLATLAERDKQRELELNRVAAHSLGPTGLQNTPRLFESYRPT